MAGPPKLLANGYEYWCKNDTEHVPKLDAAEAEALKEANPEKQIDVFYEQMGFELEPAWPTDDPRLSGTVTSAYDRFDLLKMQNQESERVVELLRKEMYAQPDHPMVTGGAACWKCQKVAPGGEEERSWIKMNVKSRLVPDGQPGSQIRCAMFASRECANAGWLAIRLVRSSYRHEA